MKVAVIGAAGYAGGELLRLLLNHPEVQECVGTSRSQAGKRWDEVHPGLVGLTEAHFTAVTPSEAARGRDVVFLALEHGESSRVIEEIFEQSPGLIVDLAADFRVRHLPTYERYYGPHAAPGYLDRFAYGLADVLGDQLRGSRAIAAPGCFATAAQLALYPLASVEDLSPAIFAITGSSGAGVHPKATTHHPARANNVFAYSALSHRHDAEIGEQWRKWTGCEDARVRLMAHSGPFVRGIYLTLTVRRHDGRTAGARDTESLFKEAYLNRPFVRLMETPPELTHAVGTNNALIYIAESEDGSDVQVCVAIDNLIKGAGGQAVQAMNLALGLPEQAGLRVGGMFPC
jgi:N-acetyl-gamma-glutamyl-phosphate/LysW-gamma-L-alpha-aminoadipyl-6-phosphate reductase